MHTRIPHWRTLVLPGAFVLLCITLTLLTLHIFGGALPLEPHSYRVGATFPQASNLVQGSDVQIAGVDIGRVVDVERQGTQALATLEIEPRFAPLHSDASAIARTKTLLGEGYVEIAPGAQSAPAIPEDGQIAHVEASVQLDEFLEAFDPGTRARMRELFGGLSKTVRGKTPESFNQALASAGPFAGSLGQVLDVVDSDRQGLQGVIASSAKVFNALGAREGALRSAVSAGNDLLHVTGDRNRQLTATIQAFPEFLRQLRTTSDTIAGVSPELNRAVAALVPVAPRVQPALKEVKKAAPEFRGLFNDLPKTISAGDGGLPAVSQMASAARVGLRAFYPTARELIPFMQLLGVNRKALLILANVAAVNAGTYVGPTGTVIGYATGLPTVWNKTISGWKKKLPTNRQNPYPKPPNGLLDTGKIGVLKSYDCRNTGNRPYLPPLGGAPPCIEQKPWVFNGVKAAYPRLQLAPP